MSLRIRMLRNEDASPRSLISYLFCTSCLNCWTCWSLSGGAIISISSTKRNRTSLVSLLIMMHGSSEHGSKPSPCKNDTSSLYQSFGDFRRPYSALSNLHTFPGRPYPGGHVL